MPHNYYVNMHKKARLGIGTIVLVSGWGCQHHHHPFPSHEVIIEHWKVKLVVHLLPSGGLVTTAPTVIQSSTPIKQKMAATTITIMCQQFILSKRTVNKVIKIHILR